MIKFEALKNGNKKQQNVYLAIENLGIMKDLAECNPILFWALLR